jgi:three-Cys-motif partner protein
VDCFAGKGKFEDGEDGSPRIALAARAKALAQTKARNPLISTYFIDLNYADELSANIADYMGNIQVVSGKYEEKIEDLLANQRNNNVFLYIDPYGIQALDYAMLTSFADKGFPSIELLINMNSFGFIRDACRIMKADKAMMDAAFENLDIDLVEYDPAEVSSTEQSAELMTSIAGGEYWKGIVSDLQTGKIDGYEAEERFSAEYRQQLRKKFKYVLDMPIRLKGGQRPKYRMIHVTQHPDGCYLMAENMQNRKEQLFTWLQDHDQLTLWDMDSNNVRDMGGSYITKDDIKKKLQGLITRYASEIRLKPLLTDFVNEYGVLCDFNIIHELLDTLQTEGVINIIRSPANSEKTGKPLKFWDDGKGDHEVIIRRLR